MNVIEILSAKKPVLGNEIGGILVISRVAAHKRINTLKQTGCAIKSSSSGILLIKNVNLFNENEL